MHSPNVTVQGYNHNLFKEIINVNMYEEISVIGQ